jgi:hypothetical protein
MNCALFYCTFARDLEYLKYSLRSVEKFSSGFSEVVILVPDRDLPELKKLVSELSGTSGIPIRCIGGDEWGDGKGMLWHECQIIRADQHCPDSDIIFHFDPDCIFTEPVTPKNWFWSNKPMLLYEAYDTLCARQENHRRWQEAAERCLPFRCPNETMRAFPIAYDRELYAATRKLIAQTTGEPVDDYIRSCQGFFPHGFAEFPTLGAVAMEKFPELYWLHDCGKQANPMKHDFPVFQAWSHAAPDVATDLWYFGEYKKIIPLEIYKGLGLA